MENHFPAGQNSSSAQAALRQLADSAKMLVWMTDVNDAIIYLNKSVSALFERSDQLNISAWRPFMHPDDLPRVDHVLSRAKELCEEYKVEYRVIRSDGSIRWMMGCGAPRFSESGDYLGYNGTLVDVTDRYQALERLAKSEVAHRLLTENSSDLISHHAPDGTLLYISPSVERILGFASWELVGAHGFNNIHPDDVPVLQEELSRQIEEGAESRVIEIRKRHKDGHHVWMGTKARVLIDPLTKEQTGIVSVSRDITFEREAKVELRKREERFRSMANLSSDWYWETDENDRFTFISDSVLRLFGALPEYILGKTHLDLGIDPTQPGLQEYFPKVTRREPFRNIHYAVYVPIKKMVRYANTSGEPFFEDGVFKGYRGVARDITEEMELGEKLAQIKEQERARIAREIHDEMGGNLTAIKIGLAQLAGRLPAEETRMREKVDYVDLLVDRTIETVYRISRDLRPSILDLGIVAAINWQAKEFEKQFDMPCNVFTQEEEIDLPGEQAIGLFGIFQEALTNIGKHAGATHVTVNLTNTNRTISLEIGDDGRGITEADRFKPKSFGIRSMVERANAMGGHLDVGCAPDGGCRVMVKIPMSVF